MRRVFAIIVILALLALGGGFLWLGEFPPRAPHPVPVEKAIPSNKINAG